MFRQINIFTLAITSLFLYSQIADAGIVRTSGRGDLSGNYDEGYYFVDNQYLNERGRILESAFENQFYNKSVLRTVGGGGRGLGAVPNDCVNGYTEDQVDSLEADRQSELNAFYDADSTSTLTDAEYDAAEQAIQNKYDGLVQALTVGEPCVWEFEQGESLSMFGFFSLFFGDADVNYNVTWNVAGQNVAGAINTAGNLDTPDGIINNGWVTLNADVDLVPGDYSVFVNVSISSSTGKFFYDRNRPFDEVNFRRVCEYNPAYDDYYNALEQYENYLFDPNNWVGPIPLNPGSVEPDIEICGYDSVDSSYDVVSAQRYFTSDREALRILPSSVVQNPPTTDANAPASIAMLILGFGVMAYRARQRTAK
jgi:hypothetical protein